jgi:UDP-GlcNAc:undecaprenyl-phosphate GlcNAc-1-phosphate transferase
MHWAVLAAVVGTFGASVVMTGLVRRWARRTDFVDRPAGHKQHANPTPLGGGIAITWTLCGSLLAGTFAVWLAHQQGWTPQLPELLRLHAPGIASRLPNVLALVGGALVLHIVGWADDRRPMGPGVKFLVQFLVAAVLVVGFGMRVAEFLGAPLAIGLSILWIVLIINAFNFLDNMDGLNAGVAAISAAILASAAMRNGQVFVPTVAWALVGTLLGFLVFNFSPASIFMGDAGSLVVGYFLAMLSVLTTYQEYDPARGVVPYGVLMPVVVLAVPLYDVISVVIVRLRAGDSPFRGDRRHFSHRLTRRGMTPRAAVLTIYLATMATSLAALQLPGATWLTALLVLTQTLCVVLIIAILEGRPPTFPRR